MQLTHEEQLKCTLSEKELLQIARDQARKGADLDDLNRQLDRAKADYKSAIIRMETEIADANRKLRDGWELRSVKCLTSLDDPFKGTARIYREDTGEVVRERPMQASELQRERPLEEGQPETVQVEIRVVEPELPAEDLPTEDDSDA